MPPISAPISADLSVAAVDAWRARIRQSTFANYHYQMGAAMLRAGDLEPAAAALNRAIEIDETMTQAHVRLLTCLERIGDAARQAAAHQAATAVDPNYAARGRARIAMELLDAGDDDDALSEAEQATAADPSLDEAQCACGLALLKRGDVVAGLAALDRAVAAGGPIREKALEEAVWAANVALRASRREEAFAVAQWAAERDENNAAASAAAGRAAVYIGRLTEARRFLTRSVAGDPTDFLALSLLGQVLEWLGEAAAAADLFKRIVDGGGGDKPAHSAMACCGLGRLAMASGRFDEAAAHFADAVRIAPAFPAAAAHQARGRLAAGDVAAALEAARRATSLDPNDVWAATALGTVAAVAGDVAGALPLLRRGAGIQPMAAWPLVDLAYGLAAAGLDDEARATLRRAAVFAPAGLAPLTVQRPWAGEIFDRLTAG